MYEQFVKLVKDLISISPAFKTYLKIIYYVIHDHKQHRVLTLRELSKKVGISPKNLKKYVVKLKELGYVEIYESASAILILPGDKIRGKSEEILQVIAALLEN